MYYIWKNWDDYHHSTGDVNVDIFGDWFYEQYGEELGVDHHYESEVHPNPLCGVEDWHTVTKDCDYFGIEYRETCYIMYSHDPCNMTNYTCYMPHYDVNGTWQYQECSSEFEDLNRWSELRDHKFWHDTAIDEQNPYIHEFWDNHHGIYDPNWWNQDYNATELAIYSDYDQF